MPSSSHPMIHLLARCARACLRTLALRQAHSHAWLKKTG